MVALDDKSAFASSRGVRIRGVDFLQADSIAPQYLDRRSTRTSVIPSFEPQQGQFIEVDDQKPMSEVCAYRCSRETKRFQEAVPCPGLVRPIVTDTLHADTHDGRFLRDMSSRITLTRPLLCHEKSLLIGRRDRLHFLPL